MNRPGRRQERNFKLAAEWRTGPRSMAWDELWKVILSEVIGDLSEAKESSMDTNSNNSADRKNDD